MRRTCAVCGKPIIKDVICNHCYKAWVENDKYSPWLAELIRLENNNYMREYRHPEIVFSDFFTDSEADA